MQKESVSVSKALNYILSFKEKINLLYILLLVIIGGALELIAVAVFTPFIEAFTNQEAIHTSTVLRLINELFGFSDVNEFIIGIAAGIIVIYVVKNFFIIYEKNAVYKFSYDLQHRVATRLIEAYLIKPYTFHLQTNPAELIRTVQVDADYFATAVIHVIELVMELIVCFTLIVYLFLVSPMITMVTAAFLSVSVLGYIIFSRRKLRNLGKKVQQYSGTNYKYLNQAFGGVKEIKVLGRENYFVSQFSETLAKYVRCLRFTRLAAVLPKYFIESVCIVGLMVAVIVKVKTNPASMSQFVPQLAVFATAAFRLMPSVGRINEHTSAINSNFPSIKLVYNDLKSVEDVVNQRKEIEKDEQKIELSNEIKVENVSFGYPDAEKKVIVDASFKIPKGQTVAFIGESGAGKTTMADIILGVLKPDSGSILADDVDVYSHIGLWQKNIGYIPQTIYLSDDTIRNNIAFGLDNSEIDEDAVVDAARKAQLMDFIESLPDGLDTVVGERGARLSGGQRQRIGIARALYSNPEILVLDEATSALDNETETAVMEAIDGLHGLKTMLIIAHRLSTIKNADIIYEVGDGKVVVRDKEEIVK